MSVKLEVRMSAPTGMPYTCVPSYAMWELVEYLAAHRTPVLYGYSADGFTVTFQRLDLQAARDLMDAWAQPRTLNPNSPNTAPEYDEELCYLPG